MIGTIDRLMELIDKHGVWTFIIFVVIVFVLLNEAVTIYDHLANRFGWSTKKSREKAANAQKLSEHDESLTMMKQEMQEMKNELSCVNVGLQDIKETMEVEREKSNARERNSIRDKLLANWRYFTSPEHNPTYSWSEMEADSFWEMYRDYKELHGNHFVESKVVPDMQSLAVIPMSEVEKLTGMMKSRK
ncbi:MAG: hypothetical protein [Bacteriophage sp.]|nr:MAG: hypothetical protein [Bacteriophage sp.]